MVEAQDLAQDTERRIVNDDAACVVLGLVVAARIKRPAKGRPVQMVFLRDPGGHALVHRLRRVTVVRRFFWLELFDELLVFVAFAFGAFVVPFARLEPVGVLVSRFQLEVEVQLKTEGLHVEGRQLCQLSGEKIQVEAGGHGQLVVDEDIGALLLVGQVRQPDHLGGGAAELLQREEAAVALDDLVVFVDRDGVVVAELLNAPGDLLDLLRRVDFRVVWVFFQSFDVDCLDLHGDSAFPPSIRLFCRPRVRPASKKRT